MTDIADLLARMSLLAAEIEAPLICDHRGSEYGACHDCMNTGALITCAEDEAMLDAAKALRAAVRLVRAGMT